MAPPAACSSRDGSEVLMQRKRVGIVLFDDIEVLDFCGPFEVFSVTRLHTMQFEYVLGSTATIRVLCLLPLLRLIVPCPGRVRRSRTNRQFP